VCFKPLALKKIKASTMLLRISSCVNSQGGSRGLSKPRREREGGSECQTFNWDVQHPCEAGVIIPVFTDGELV